MMNVTAAMNMMNVTAAMNMTDVRGGGGGGGVEVEEAGVSTETYVMVVIMAILSGMGTAGNALVIYVFHMKQDRLISTFFIVTLGIVDFFTCLIIIPFTIYMEFVEYVISYDFPCKVYFFLITYNIPLSILIMVAIAIDRYFCICHPFLNALNMTRAKIMTACMCLFAAALGISVSFQHGIIYIGTLNDLNETLTMASSMNMSHDQIRAEDSNLEAVCSQFEGSHSFIWYYQKCYFAMFFICLLIVIILYSMIYYSVHSRRSARARQRSTALLLVQNANGGGGADGGETVGEAQETHIAPAIEAQRDTTTNGNHSTTKSRSRDVYGGSRRRSTMRNADRIANIKTALMLFVVTVVFMVTYIPAVLMALQAITYVRLVFYMYFANNVANPIIYGFMNKNFRDDLHRIFCHRRT